MDSEILIPMPKIKESITQSLSNASQEDGNTTYKSKLCVLKKDGTHISLECDWQTNMLADFSKIETLSDLYREFNREIDLIDYENEFHGIFGLNNLDEVAQAYVNAEETTDCEDGWENVSTMWGYDFLNKRNFNY